MRIKILSFVILLILLSSNFIISANQQYKIEEENEDNKYYSYDELTKLLNELFENFPAIFSYKSIGKTYEQRDIWPVKISDNVEIEEEPEIFIQEGCMGTKNKAIKL